MKKLIFLGIAVLLAGLGFVLFSATARAADNKTTESKVYLSYPYVAKLESGLNNLKQNVLPELNSQIQNNEMSAEKKETINGSLNNIQSNLIAINFSLENPDLVLLENGSIPETAPLLAENNPATESGPSTASVSAKDLIGDVAAAETPIPASATEEKGKWTASIKSAINANLKKASLPVAIGLIVALAILWLIWFRKPKNKNGMEIPAPPIEQNPINLPYENSNPQIINLPGPQGTQQHFPDIQ